MRDQRRENAGQVLHEPSVTVGQSETTCPERMRVLSSLFSRSVLVTIVAAAACDPGTTRPDVLPFPEAQQIEVILDRTDAITQLRDALVADSFPIVRFNARDAWLEGPWMDRRTLRPVPAHHLGPEVVRLRAWSEPARPGDSFLIVELAWRPTADPSVPERTLERPLALTDSLSLRLKATLKKLDDAVGFQEPGAKAH